MRTLPRSSEHVHLSLRTASRLARADAALAQLERDKPGHGAAELARRVKAACPDVSAAQCRRAADKVLEARLARPEHAGVASRESQTRPDTIGWAKRRTVPSRALGRTAEAVPSLADRLLAHKRAKVRAAFESAGFRHSRAWENDIRIEFGAPGARQATATGWIDYKSHGCRTGLVSETVWLSVPADWGTRVRPLDTTAGLLLLDAERLPTDGPTEVYRAAWARQGKGVSLVVDRGFLARHVPTGTAYHSTHADPAKAISGLKRQVTIQGLPSGVRDARRAARIEASQRRRTASLERLGSRLASGDLGDVADVRVTRADSLRAGNCEPGTDSFIERFFPDRDATTIGEIAAAVGRTDLAGLSGADLTLARQVAAACLGAIRRNRTASRTLALRNL